MLCTVATESSCWGQWEPFLHGQTGSQPVRQEQFLTALRRPRIEVGILAGTLALTAGQSWPWVQNAGSSLVLEQEAKLRWVEENYMIRRKATVQRFLDTHPEIVEFLLEAYGQAQRHFGSDVQVALEVVSDPEVDAPEELFGYILTSLAVDDALTRLDSFDADWFLDQLDRVGGRFNFNLEFL